MRYAGTPINEANKLDVDEYVFYNLPKDLKKIKIPEGKQLTFIIDNENLLTGNILEALSPHNSLITFALDEVNINTYMLDNYHFKYFYTKPCQKMEDVEIAIDYGACAVVLGGGAAFDLPTISYYCHDKGVECRITPNLRIDDFYIRPEDIDLYAPYIDVLDFSPCALGIQKTLLRIYRKDKEWYGLLNEIIIDYGKNTQYSPFNVDARNLPTDFGRFRLGCHQRCKKDECNYCATAYELAKFLTQQGIYVQQTSRKESSNLKK